MKKNLLIAKLLSNASDEFSNHGCNDLSKDVKELITPELLNDIQQWLGDDITINNIPDWMLMKYLSDKLVDEA